MTYKYLKKKKFLKKNQNVQIDNVLSTISIAEGQLKVSKLDGSVDDGMALRAIIKKASAKHPVGASYRWALNSSAHGKLQLQVRNGAFF